MQLEIRRSPGAKLPYRGYDESVGLDLYAYLPRDGGRGGRSIIPPRTTKPIQTGIFVRPPPGHAVLVCSRSGMAKSSLFVANAPGVVDPDYRGEIIVLLYNGSHETYYVEHEQRIAQMLVVPVPLVEMVEVESFPPTRRGEAGFGSTGQ